jgi:NitT/TauT family transport system substrate-binding protein
MRPILNRARRRLSVLIPAVALVGAAVGLTACGSSSSDNAATAAAAAHCKSMTTIRIATTPYQDSLIMTLGNELGWYQAECLNVTFQNVAFGDEPQVLSSGTSDVAWFSDPGVYEDYHQDPNLVYYYPWDIFYNGFALMARPSLHLKTAAQYMQEGQTQAQAVDSVINELHGKSVITTLNNSRAEEIQSPILKAGKPLNWMTYINEGAAPGLALFLRGTGDTYIAGIPQRAELLQDGYVPLLTGVQLAPPPLNGFNTTKSFYEAHKSALLALLHVTFMEIRYTDANLNQVADYVATTYTHATGDTFTPADFKEYWQKLELYPTDAADAQKMVFDSSGVAYWQKTWDLDGLYFVNLTHTLTQKTPTSAFLGEQIQQSYIAKYGANETGWMKVTGSLPS